MKKRIRFRGYALVNGDNENNFERNYWVYGYLAGENVINIEGSGGSKFSYIVDVKSIGQWTGLNDIKNNSIYEGDIIETQEYFKGEKITRKYIVEWYKGKCCFVLKEEKSIFPGEILLSEEAIKMRKIRVISNTYEERFRNK